jgi:hypothetical protein
MANNILSFDQFANLYEQEKTGIKPEAAPVTDKVIDDEGEPILDLSSIISVIKDNAKKEVTVKKEEAPVKEGKIFEAVPEKVNTLKVAKSGENSERVKDIQKYLGLKVDGNFGDLTKKAVMDFQKENSIVVDGKVGTQTYGKILAVKAGIKDDKEIERLKSLFVGGAKKPEDKKTSIKTADTILGDPRLSELFESVSVVTIDGVTRVVCIPKADAPSKIEEMKKAQKIGENVIWLEHVAKSVGKGIIFTAGACVIVPLAVAQYSINSAIAVIGYVGKGAVSVVTSVIHGIGQISHWIADKTVAIYKTVSTKVVEFVKNFTTGVCNLIKNVKAGLVAFAAAAAHFLVKVDKLIIEAALTIIIAMGATLIVAWKGITKITELAATGVKFLAKEAKGEYDKMKTNIENGYTKAKDVANKAAAAVDSGLKYVGDEAKSSFKAGAKTMATFLVNSGNWINSLAESLYLETGDPIFESLMD